MGNGSLRNVAVRIHINWDRKKGRGCILEANGHFPIGKGGRKMKKLIFILFLFIFASSASATIYKWVDQGGAVNFADDYSKVPPDYRDSVEKVSTPKMEASNPFPSPC